MTLLKILPKGSFRRKGEGFQKIAEKIHYLRRYAYVDDSLLDYESKTFLENHHF